MRPETLNFAGWLTERLSESERQALRQLLAYPRIEFCGPINGWTWANVLGYESTWVAFRIDGEQLFYQCNCKPFQTHAPQPCVHIVASIAYHEIKQGRIAQHSGWYGRQPPLKKLKTRPIGMVSDETEAVLVQAAGGKIVHAHPTPRPPSWKPYLQALRTEQTRLETHASWPPQRELLYVIDMNLTLQGNELIVDTMTREPKKSGGWKSPSPFPLSAETLTVLPDPDREAATLLLGAPAATDRHYNYYDDERISRRRLTSFQAAAAIPLMCRTGRCFLRAAKENPSGHKADETLQPLQWDDGGAWELCLDIARNEPKKQYIVTASLHRGEQVMSLDAPTLLTSGGLVFTPTHVAALDDRGAFEWVAMLRAKKQLRVPFEQGDELLTELYRFSRLPRPNLPEELRIAEIQGTPKPRLTIKAPPTETYRTYYAQSQRRLIGVLEFDYDGVIASHREPAMGIFARDRRTIIRRDLAAENAAFQRMLAAGFRMETAEPSETAMPRLVPKLLPGVVRTLLLEGWHVEADGKLYRRAGEIHIDVTSGIDWFDLDVKADFGGVSASLPKLLAALRKGESLVQLDDGTFGMLPEEWLKKYAPLAGVGTVSEEQVRFSRTQVGLLDALLAAQPQATFDEAFRRVRDEFRNFSGIAPQEPTAGFIGELRPYQCEALGWFDFLRRFGFGGCLADDMGLGKTVQVLALLEGRRGSIGKPSMVVVPRSLVFNWKQEAARFSPQLRVLDHSTPVRAKGGEHFSDYDLVITTYGTIRKDAPLLKDVTFDYIIIDEAQAVKNAASESAKAVRLLHGDHRLALSGTPVQNHLGDLWSLFDFLNPGMLGSVTAFSGIGSVLRTPDDETRQLLSRGLRPFILRRTKEQVAKELPARQEQTLYCELEADQRKLYDELRDHYRQSLLGKIEREGINKAKIQILEALLRLRQAAIHPGLIDKTRVTESSAKLDLLLPQLREVIAEGHKALVFSQFTGMLSILKKKLDAEDIAYEYLDGKTRDRQERVEKFQADADTRLFLISLKAGGVGLNLTAADYVFLLDPWWNPAVEAQAIDRTHRIGQTKQVFAFRLIAKGTVEEKVLALQQTKRALADAIINADNSLIRTLGKDDLELLLS